jgi:hypothetical protein
LHSFNNNNNNNNKTEELATGVFSLNDIQNAAGVCVHQGHSVSTRLPSNIAAQHAIVKEKKGASFARRRVI